MEVLMKLFLFILGALTFFNINSAFASPYFGGTAPGWVLNCQQIERSGTEHTLVEYNRCNSAEFGGYMDELSRYYMAFTPGTEGSTGSYNVDPSIQSVHAVVTDAKIDNQIPYNGACNDTMCFRVLIYINGDSQTGTHVATWATSPGRVWTDGSGGNYTPESYEVLLSERKPNQNSLGHFKLQQDHEMGLKGVVTGKYPGYYVMDHYINSDDEDMPWATCYHFGICFHASGQVNGKTESHGCTRLKYLEAKRMNFLARHVGRNFTVETRFTERSTLTDEERNAVSLQNIGIRNIQEVERLRNLIDNGDTEEIRERARRDLENRSLGTGGLY